MNNNRSSVQKTTRELILDIYHSVVSSHNESALRERVTAVGGIDTTRRATHFMESELELMLSKLRDERKRLGRGYDSLYVSVDDFPGDDDTCRVREWTVKSSLY